MRKIFIGNTKNIGNTKMMEKWYQESAKFPTTYYGQIAFMKIYPDKKYELTMEENFDKDYKNMK